MNLSEDFIRLTPFDLHVLSAPPAFVLSQDQTLMLEFDSKLYLLTVSGSFVRLRLLYLVRNRLLQFVSHFINVFTLSSSLPLYSFQGSLAAVFRGNRSYLITVL